MAAEWIALGIFVLMFALLAIGVQLGLAMAGAALLGLVALIGPDGGLALAGQTVYEAALSFELSVIPLFVLMGAIAARSGLSADLFEAFNALLARRRGGLAHAAIGACAAFGTVCGSSMATAATMGRVALPEMRRFGYDPSLAAGTVAAGGTIGILIPPSVVLAVYGLLTETNIGTLFIAGIVPGVVLTLAFMIAIVAVTAWRPSQVPPVSPDAGAARRGSAWLALQRIWATLALFALVIGGIYAGLFTPTEAAGIGCFGALAIGVAMRRLSVRVLVEALFETLETTSMIFLILIGAVLFTQFVTFSDVPGLLGQTIGALHLSPLGTILLILFVYVVLGAVMDAMAMVFLTIPVFFPIIKGLGYDPVWFGVLVVLMVELALISPPLGMNVFVIRGIDPTVSLRQIFRGVMPFCAAMAAVVLLVLAEPRIVTFLPSLAR